MICEYCGKEYEKGISNRFCSISCAHGYASKYDDKNEQKHVKCIICNKDILVNKRATASKCKCEKCSKRRKCLVCGQEFYTKLDSDICSDKCRSINKQKKLLIQYFGFNKNYFGSVKIFDEYNRIKNDLNKLYWDDNKSFADIAKIYGYTGNPGNFTKVFRQLGIKSRSAKECVVNAYLNGKISPTFGFPYKQTWHTTWNNKEVYLRSSYELDYANELDKQKINYDVESLRIKYFDTQRNEYRCAIPDFYLPDTNTIVEIKSIWTLDKQEMKDKFKAYKDLGYNFKLILEHKETNIETIDNE